MRHPLLPSLCATSILALLLTGCSSSFDPLNGTPAAPASEIGAGFKGKLMGGRQPIVGAHIYLFAADTNAYGNASDSLVISDPGAAYPTTRDVSGDYYITTDSSGGFEFASGEYACSVGQNAYLYSVSGNPGGGTNTAAGLMAVLGTCESGGTFTAVTNGVYMTEVSTVAAAYAFSGFATDARHVASANTSLSKAGLNAAFNNAANLFSISAGPQAVALSTTPAGNGSVPQSEIDSLADIIAACINSTGPSSSACSTLFSNALSAGASGTTPTDTATAMINIAHNPGNAVTTLFNIPTGVVPWGPYLTTAPNDFTVALRFTDSSLVTPSGVAVDAGGNAWVTGGGSGTISKFSPLGVVLSGTGGYTNTDMSSPYGIAVDNSGNAWVADQTGFIFKFTGSSSIECTGADMSGPQNIAIDQSGNAWATQYVNSSALVVCNSSGTDISNGSGKYTGGGLGAPYSIAFDGSGNAFVANDKPSYATVSELNSSGTAVSPGAGYGAAKKQKNGTGIAIDFNENAWMVNNGSNSVLELSNTGVNQTGSPFTGGGISGPQSVAMDGLSDVWIINGSSVSEVYVSTTSSTIVAQSPSTGYQGGLSGALGIAVDGSGNVWTASGGNNTVIEFIGAATPVVTPIVEGITSPYIPGTQP